MGLNKVLAGGAALGAYFMAATAQAAVLAYDPFNVGAGPSQYAEGDEGAGTNVLGGQNPTTGPGAFYSGGWVQNGGDSQAVKNVPGLSYPNFPQSGGVVTDAVQFNCCSFGRSGRPIAGGLGGGAARTIYQSFLINFGTQGTDAPTDFGKRAYEMWNGGVGDSNLAVDLFVNHFSGVNNLTLQITTPSGTTSVLVGGGGLNLAALAAANGGVHLVVLKFEFDPAAPDVVTLFLDPTSSIEGDHAAAAIVAALNSDLMITHHGAITNFTFSGGGHVPGTFDEVRWGDTFADVTPFSADVPAPPAAGLLSLGVLGVAALRRRRGRLAAAL